MTIYVYLLLLFVPSLRAGDKAQSEILLEVMGDWAHKLVSELSLPRAPKPSRSVLACVDYTTYSAKAVFGSLVSEERQHRRPARIEVVVGDDQLNSSRFSGGFKNVLGTPRFVIDDVPVALARDIWVASDDAYKRAILQYLNKKMALAHQQGDPPPPDWSQSPVVVDKQIKKWPPLEEEKLRQLIIEATAQLKDFPELSYAEANIRSMQSHYHLATSLGTRLIQPSSYISLNVRAEVKKADGLQIVDQINWVVENYEDFPTKKQLLGQVKEMGQLLVLRSQAAVLDYYEGPVVFEQTATADLFRYLAAHELLGTPKSPSARQSYSKLNRRGPRIGRRLLPKGWAIEDDPALKPKGSPSGYRYDKEGARGKRVELVKDGLVADLVMSRIPRKDRQESNGHARGSVAGQWQARLSTWTVRPAHNLSDKAFAKQVERVMQEAQIDRILVIKRLMPGWAGSLPHPTLAVLRDRQGKETPVLALNFERVDRRTLRDIQATSGTQTVSYLAPWNPKGQHPTSAGLPSAIIAPKKLLISEIEAVYPGPNQKPPTYKAPMSN
jgi:hypothetical protein